MIAALLLAVSTFPPMLPRGVMTQLVESAVLTGLGWRVDRWVGARQIDLPRVPWVSSALTALSGDRTGELGGVLVGVWVAVALGLQDAQSLAMGLAPVGWVPLVVGATLVLLAARHRAVVRPIAGVLCMALVLALVAGSATVAGPAPVAAATSITETAPVPRPGPPPVHVAVPLGPGSPGARADAAVRALRDAGGLERSTLVVVVPTGSGWADPTALATLDEATGSDVATVSLAYDDAPSWWAYLTARDEAVATTAALLDAVADARAPGTRVLLYGQSLGALAGAEAWALRPDAADGALWVGPPADTRTAGGAVLAHTSDPAVVWSPRLLVAPPERPTGRPWVPVVSFVQTSVDLLAAVGAPAGHGHHYGAEHRPAWDALLRDGVRSGSCPATPRCP